MLPFQMVLVDYVWEISPLLTTANTAMCYKELKANYKYRAIFKNKNILDLKCKVLNKTEVVVG